MIRQSGSEAVPGFYAPIVADPVSARSTAVLVADVVPRSEVRLLLDILGIGVSDE